MKVKVSEHLAQDHRERASHHDEMIKAHTTGLEKDKAMGGTQADFHKAAIASHTKARDSELDKCAACEKADSDSLNKLEPTEIRGVIPTNPLAVPRFGQREISGSVPADLGKIIGLNPEDLDAAEPSLR